MRHRYRIPRALVLSLVLASACASLPPKVAIDKSDRAALTAVRAFQVAEEAAWHVGGAYPSLNKWPTPEQHAAINGKVSQAYQLIIDVARFGLSLPPGGKLTVADLGLLAQLSQLVADIVSLTRTASVEVQQAALGAQVKVGALVTSVKGGGQ